MKREDSPPSSILTLPIEGQAELRAFDRATGQANANILPPASGDDIDLAGAHIDPLIDQVDNLHAFARTGLVGNTVGAGVIVALYAHSVPMLTMTVWAILFGAALVLRAVLTVTYLRRWRGSSALLRSWRNRYLTGVLATGAMWGAAVWLFYPYGGNLERIALLLTVYSFCISAVPALATQFGAFITFVALTFVPMILRIALLPDRDGWTLAGILFLIFGITVMLGRSYQRSFARVVALKQRGLQLLAQLQVEKVAADQARREAETANRAKTQFFAAASHDLRQPLHALGLFAEALRHRIGSDAEVAHLVNSINSSVDALEGLFSELLDITKIDTGGVEARPENFSVEAMFARLKLHYEPTAFEKGLALRFRGGKHFGYADPLLLDRVVRNLLSNAIRYTNDGGIVVGARQRGDKLRFEVWDTGLGIRPHEQDRIFEEFYQVSNDAPPLDPTQRKGLGLGLAIVRRLARVLDAPLRLRSVPGRGTMFSIEIPLGQRPKPSEPQVPRSSVIGLTLDRRLIVIVEDDPAVLGGLQVLLKSWGADVLAFDSYSTAADWAAAAAARKLVKPDLLIVDFRLESGHTGLEVIQAMRAAFGSALPAVIVTGSLMSNQEGEAHAHDFHLLLKPVVPTKLRAMIAFKLGQR
jgi:signal transduction histidine kinase/CheY-like chemotaxis protein